LLNFQLPDDSFDTPCDLEETDRTKTFLLNWLQVSSPDMLVRFVQAITGQIGLTEGLHRITVCVVLYFSNSVGAFQVIATL
jgi:hypothetical protein